MIKKENTVAEDQRAGAVEVTALKQRHAAAGTSSVSGN